MKKLMGGKYYLFIWGHLYCYLPHNTLFTKLMSKAVPRQRNGERRWPTKYYPQYIILPVQGMNSVFLEAEWNKQVQLNILFESMRIDDEVRSDYSSKYIMHVYNVQSVQAHFSRTLVRNCHLNLAVDK